MTSSNLITVDGEPISLELAIAYLQQAGRLQEFVQEIVRQHVLTREVRSQDYNLSQEYIEQQLLYFRSEYQLTDEQAFQTWLETRKLDYKTFFQQYQWNLLVDYLKHQVSQNELPSFLQAHKPLLDQVILSWIAVDSKDDVLELERQLNLGYGFDQLAEFYPGSNEDNYGIEEAFSRAGMPDTLKAAIASVEPGNFTKPTFLEARWYIFRVDAVISAELNDPLKTQLEADLFEQWLEEKINSMNVQLEIHRELLLNPMRQQPAAATPD